MARRLPRCRRCVRPRRSANDGAALQCAVSLHAQGARSILAECIMNRLGLGRFRGHSAGSQPSGRVHPMALDLARQLHYDTGGLRSKSWEEFSRAPKLHFVFTVCDDAADEVCPVWPGQPTTAPRVPRAMRPNADSPSPRPIGVCSNGSASSPACRSLDRLNLQSRLDDIGRQRN